MQQRRLRLGDILDDYCPRERRVTNHVVVAMIEDQVKQTRCTTCDADHEYKGARVPAARRKKDASQPADAVPTALVRPAAPDEETIDEEVVSVEVVAADVEAADVPDEQTLTAASSQDVMEPTEGDEETPIAGDDDGPVHRRLIRATLPRPEGQTPERKMPEFTVRQPGHRDRGPADGNRGGNGPQKHSRGRRAMRGQNPQGSGAGGPQRFGGPRQGSSGAGSDGNRQGPPGGQRGGGRPPQGPPRGPRQPGRKRGR
jgi:hypothetical protein